MRPSRRVIIARAPRSSRPRRRPRAPPRTRAVSPRCLRPAPVVRRGGPHDDVRERRRDFRRGVLGARAPSALAAAAAARSVAVSIRLCTCGRDANAWLIPAAVASDSKHPRYILAGTGVQRQRAQPRLEQLRRRPPGRTTPPPPRNGRSCFVSATRTVAQSPAGPPTSDLPPAASRGIIPRVSRVRAFGAARRARRRDAAEASPKTASSSSASTSSSTRSRPSLAPPPPLDPRGPARRRGPCPRARASRRARFDAAFRLASSRRRSSSRRMISSTTAPKTGGSPRLALRRARSVSRAAFSAACVSVSPGGIPREPCASAAASSVAARVATAAISNRT